MGGGALESALREGGSEPGLKLIETVLWDGRTAPRWPLHLARLQLSAGLLGWDCPDVVLAGPDHPARLRLTLDREGAVEWTVAALPSAKPEWHIGLAAEQLRSDDPWLRVKSTKRAAYDRALLACQGARLDDAAISPHRAAVSKPHSSADIERERRLAEALRANLRKRKAKAREAKSESQPKD